MNDLPLVSIAAINYNNSRYVIETLESIRNQTYDNIELIIVDDCSTDNSFELITEWLKGYQKPYKIVRHEVNKGVCAACNSGVQNASGKYYSAIATDDLMLSEKTAMQVAMLEGSDDKVGAVYSDAQLIDEDSQILEKHFIQNHRQFVTVPTGNIYEALLQGNYIPAMSFLFKKDIFNSIGFFDESIVYEDYDMWLRVARKYEIIFSDHISVKYRIRQSSLVSTIKNWIYSDAKIFLKHVGAPLPVERLKNMATEAYSTNDKETSSLIKELAEKTNNTYLFTAYLLGQFAIPFSKGEIVLAKKDQRIYASAVAEMKTTEAQTSMLIDQFFTSLPEEEIKLIAKEAYENDTTDTLPIIKELYKRTQSEYYRAVLLLWKFKVFVPNGLIILNRINGYCSVNVSRHYIRLCIYKDIFGAIKTGNSSYLKRKPATP